MDEMASTAKGLPCILDAPQRLRTGDRGGVCVLGGYCLVLHAMRILAILLLLTGCATDPWSKQDIALEAAYMLVTAADMAQTLQIKDHPGMIETNPLMGEHPTDGRIYSHFATCAVLHVLAVDLLPSKYRGMFQMLGIGFESAVVYHNNTLGLNVRF